MATGDRILIEARTNSLQLEQLAVNDLAENLDSYLEPSWRSRKMVEGYRDYVSSGNTQNDAYYLMRKAFTDTKGRCNRVFGDVISSYIKPQRYPLAKTYFAEAAGAKDWEAYVRGAANQLGRDGFFKFQFKVPDRIVQPLKEKALAGLETSFGAAQIEAMLAGSHDAPPQVKSSSVWLTAVEEMYEFAGDPVILAIVQQYLGVPPIFNTPVLFLNSSRHMKNDRELSDVAQLYHHDLHRLRFVKVFVYLSDVDDDCGPHAMVKGTHLKRPDNLWEDGRHTDEAIAEAGLKDKEVRITGPAGTVFLVDTSALHKGVHPEARARLMAQVQYVNSLFGKPIVPLADRKIAHAQTAKEKEEVMMASAAIVRKYADRVGVRFMQNLI